MKGKTPRDRIMPTKTRRAKSELDGLIRRTFPHLELSDKDVKELVDLTFDYSLRLENDVCREYHKIITMIQANFIVGRRAWKMMEWVKDNLSKIMDANALRMRWRRDIK